jgi:hypothetical protein
VDIGDEAYQLLEFPDRSKLEQVFGEFCDRTAREQVRSEQRLLLTDIAAVVIAPVVMVARAVVLASLSTGVVRGGDWLVTAVSLVALGVLRTQLSRHRTAVLAGVAVVLLLLAVGGAVWSTSSPVGPEPMIGRCRVRWR